MFYPSMVTEISAGFAGLSTPNISDALDRLGIPGGCRGLLPIGSGIKMVGTAYTVRYVPTGLTKGTVGDYIDDIAEGSVVVLDNAGRTDCTVWGDLLTLTAHQRKLAGTVIDGVCRDVNRIRELGYPVFARGHFMMTGKDRVQVDGIGVPVRISNVLVRQGDLIIGDDNGVVVVPQERAAQVLDAAREISATEALIEQAIRCGEKLVEARKRHGYHSLQTKR